MTAVDSELDKQVALSLHGEWREPVPKFSTRDLAANYLVRYLKRSRVHVAIEISDSGWRCRLSGVNGSISVGEGVTRPLAICRAVLNANFNPDRRRPPAPPVRHEWTRPSDPGRRSCAECGVVLVASKGPVDRERYCNLCSWERGREKIQAGERMPRQRR